MFRSAILLALACVAAPVSASPWLQSNEVDYFVYPPRGTPQLCTLSFTLGYEGAATIAGSTTGSLAFGEIGGKPFVGLKARAYEFSQATPSRQQRRLIPIVDGAMATRAFAPVSPRTVSCEPKGAFCGAFEGRAALAIRAAVQSGRGATLLIHTAQSPHSLALRIAHRVDARNERAYNNFQACMRAIAPSG